MRSASPCSSRATRAANAESSLASVSAAGRPRAISAAKLGPDSAARGSAGGNYELERRYPEPFGRLPSVPNPTGKTIPVNKWADAILLGREGGYPSDIRMLYVAGRNLLNQVPTASKGVAALKKLAK